MSLFALPTTVTNLQPFNNLEEMYVRLSKYPTLKNSLLFRTAERPIFIPRRSNISNNSFEKQLLVKSNENYYVCKVKYLNGF